MGTTMYVIVLWDFISHLVIKYRLVDLPLLDRNKLIVDEMSWEAIEFRALIMGGFYVIMVSTLSFVQNLSA